MRPYVARKHKEISERWGVEFWQLVADFAAQDLSRFATARALGYDPKNFTSLLRRYPDRDPFPAYGVVANYLRDTGERFSVALARMAAQKYTATQAAIEIGFTSVHSLKYAMAARGVTAEFRKVTAAPKRERKIRVVITPTKERSTRPHPWREMNQLIAKSPAPRGK